MNSTYLGSKFDEARLSPVAGGTYTWKVDKDIVYADATVAELFGVSVEDARNGLPIIHFLKAIHPDDLERVSASINVAVATGAVYREEYRVISATGRVTPVLAMGQCFRNAKGVAVEYAGMLFDLCPDQSVRVRDEEMTQNCIAAYKAAKLAGNDLVTYLLSMALIEIGRKTAGDLLPDATLN